MVDRLVEPLLGGVYAGHAGRLSLEACVPGLFEVARSGGSLDRGRASRGRRPRAANTSPVFAGLVGGMGRLPELLAACPGRPRRRDPLGHDRARAAARQRRRLDRRDRPPAAHPSSSRPTPWSWPCRPRPPSRLLRDLAPAAAAELAGIDYASMAIVTLAVAREGLGELPGSGFLVPPVDGRGIKASTFSSTKWAWVASASERGVLPAGVGRPGRRGGRPAAARRATSCALAVAEVGEALGRPLTPLLDAHVQRWGGGLPQYAVGHRRAHRPRAGGGRRHLPGLELAGAAYDGVGIPACIGSGRAAAAARRHPPDGRQRGRGRMGP